MTEAQERKERVVAELREVMPRYIERLGRIDERMVEYARDLVRSDIDVHNEDELLGFRKFLRLLDTYPFDYERVKDVLYDAEGKALDMLVGNVPYGRVEEQVRAAIAGARK